jgi:hypothetical protein
MAKQEKRKSFLQRISTNYRVVFINDESLQEVASYRLSMKKLYAFFSTMFVVTVVLTVCVLLLTPLKYYIPGYGNNKTHLQVVKLKRNVDSLSDLVAAQTAYEDNIKKVINGNYNGHSDTTMLSAQQVNAEAQKSIYPSQAEMKK